jgi:MFS family permease
VIQNVSKVFGLWLSPEIWCLSFTNLTFGFCAGYMNGFVNGSFAKPSPTFGAGSLGTLLATTSLVATLASPMFGFLSQRAGKGLTISIGAACFAAIPASILLATPDKRNGYWGAALISLYILQGMARAVYESTNKAVFADFFPDDKSPPAFAKCMMQNSTAFFASFILQNTLTTEQKGALAWIVLALAACISPGYLAASKLRRRASTGLTQSLLQ